MFKVSISNDREGMMEKHLTYSLTLKKMILRNVCLQSYIRIYFVTHNVTNLSKKNKKQNS